MRRHLGRGLPLAGGRRTRVSQVWRQRPVGMEQLDQLQRMFGGVVTRGRRYARAGTTSKSSVQLAGRRAWPFGVGVFVLFVSRAVGRDHRLRVVEVISGK